MKKLLNIIMISIFSSTLILESASCSGLSCDFSHDNRTYNRSLKFGYDREITPKFSWGLSSSINYLSLGRDLLHEDGRIDLNMDYLLTQKLKTGFLFSQDIYSTASTKQTTTDYGVISKLNLAGINFIQILGARNIDSVDSIWVIINSVDSTSVEIDSIDSIRVERKTVEQGLDYGQTISFSPRIYSGSITEISLNQTITRLKNIPILKRDFRLSFFKYLSDSLTSDLGKDSLQVAYQEAWAKNKYYAGKTTTPQINDQKKKRRAFNLCTSKKVPLGMKVDFTFDFLSNTDRRFCSDWDSLNLTSLQNIYLGVKKELLQKILLGSFYKYMLSELDYTGDERDQEIEGGELGGEVKAEITPADSLYLTASIGVTSFYAPVSGLFSDRDVLTILTWGEYLHVFNPYFDLRVEGGFRNFHLLYMSDSSSFNNNHDQTYLISPTVTWQPDSKLSFKQNYKIQAIYRYYDYEKAMESSRNTLSRRASSTSAIIYQYNHRMTFSLGYTYKYEDEGPLIWKDQWVQKLSEDRRTNTINLSIDYQPIGKVSFSPKYTYEKRKYRDCVANNTTKFYRNMISSSIKYFVDKDNYLYFSVVHRLENGTKSKQETSDYVTVSVARVF